MSVINNSILTTVPTSVPLPIDADTSFWLTFSFEIPSVLCSLFILGHLLFIRNLRQSIHNHAIIILLFLGLIYVLVCVSATVSFNRHNRTVWPANPIFCLIWRFVDTGVYGSIHVFLAWASFERHILAFHSSLVRTRRKILFIHYIPMIIVLSYLCIFYVTMIFLYPCENFWDYTSSVCGTGCYRRNTIIPTYESVVHGFLSISLIAFLNVILFVRVILQKIRVHQPIQWKKHRKMAIQILSISFLFLSINFPLHFFNAARQRGWIINAVAHRLINYFTNHVIMLFPFVCLHVVPKLKEKIQNFIDPRRWFRRRRPRVMPS